MKKYKLYLLPLAFSLFAGCSEDIQNSGSPAIGDMPLEFSSAVEKEVQKTPGSRATGSGTGEEPYGYVVVDINDVEDKNYGFGAFCYYTGDTPFQNVNQVKAMKNANERVIMDNVKVYKEHTDRELDTYAAEHPDEGPSLNEMWTYSPKRFWPSDESKKLTFFTYAPWMPVSESKIDYTDDQLFTDGQPRSKQQLLFDEKTGNPYIHVTSSTYIYGMEDVLWGANEDGSLQKDISLSGNNGNMVLNNFRRAYAKVIPYLSSDIDLSTNEIEKDGFYEPEAKLLLLDFKVDNLNRSGSLMLHNTKTDEDRKAAEWHFESDQLAARSLTADADHIYPGMRYVLGDNTQINPETREITNKSLLDEKWNSMQGANSTSMPILYINDGLNGDNFFRTLPCDYNADKPITFTIRYHIIVRYKEKKSDTVYHYQMAEPHSHGDNEGNSNDNHWAELKGTIPAGQNFLGGYSYKVDMSMAAKYAGLTINVKPWQVEEQAYTLDDVPTVSDKGGKMQWTNSEKYTMDYPNRVESSHEVYVNSHTAQASFWITGPEGASWWASLIPLEGDDNAFVFVDENGEPLSEQRPAGETGNSEDNKASLYIKAKSATSNKINKALLRIYMKLSNGETQIVKALYDGGKEFTIVQEAGG